MIVSGVQQSDSVIQAHVSIFFQILFPFRLLHNIEQSSLCYTVGPCWLSILILFICLWLRWVVSVRGLSLVAASGGHSSSQCVGLSLLWPVLLWSTGSRHTGSAIVAHGPSRNTACGILPDQGSNPCPLHWQADSQPLRHQGSPGYPF